MTRRSVGDLRGCGPDSSSSSCAEDEEEAAEVGLESGSAVTDFEVLAMSESGSGEDDGDGGVLSVAFNELPASYVGPLVFGGNGDELSSSFGLDDGD